MRKEKRQLTIYEEALMRFKGMTMEEVLAQRKEILSAGWDGFDDEEDDEENADW